ncbi:hypothetical protein ACVRZD_07965 [Streptococcus hongkongensis]|nr:hypothetical protein NC01_02755 [Streptococcus uberis]
MKFLTEDDLRLKYHDFPFETFTIETNTRLTPGAKTFLMDRKITIFDNNNPLEKKKNSFLKAVNSKNRLQVSHLSHALKDNQIYLLRCEFLKVASDLVSVDLSLAQELAILEHHLGTIEASDNLSLPSLKIDTSSDYVDSVYLVNNLSTVSLFLQMDKGKILSRLYPLYFQTEAYLENNPSKALEMVGQRLGQLIAYYLNLSKEDTDETREIT